MFNRTTNFTKVTAALFTMTLSLSVLATERATTPSVSTLKASIPFKQINQLLLKHQYEKRGLVSVPLAYDKEISEHIDIFYRLVPTTNKNKSAPILAIINGGPGAPSWGYHPIEFNYADQNANSEISQLRKYFRILLIDQRGTGYSSPLDLENSNLSATHIAKYFDYDDIAKDHAEVIKYVIPTDEQYFLLARSYGGVVGFEYLIQGYKKPAGFIFSSIIQPHIDPVIVFSQRREKQRQLNLLLKEQSPSTVEKLNSLRDRLRSHALEPQLINILWSYLGKNEEWIALLDKKVTQLLALKTKSELASALSLDNITTVNLLNYVLSSKSLTPGYTDASMTEMTDKSVPFESWMIDENWTLKQLGKRKDWKGKFIANVDTNPPPASFFPTVSDINKQISTNQVLFTFGKLDSFLNYQLMSEKAKRFDTGENSHFKILDGGHGAAFSKQGAEYVSNWANGLLQKNK